MFAAMFLTESKELFPPDMFAEGMNENFNLKQGLTRTKNLMDQSKVTYNNLSEMIREVLEETFQ